jgi:single-strand DNA-binding protein
MNSIRNKVQLIGNLGMAPEIKNLDNGRKLAKLNIATNEQYTNNKGEVIKTTHWHSIIAWGKTADIVEKYLNKGSEVAVEGKLVNNNYIDKDGVKRFTTVIEINDLVLMNGKS